MIQAVIYLLCFLTSFVAMILLLRSYASGRSPLLLWSAIAFIALAMNNLLLFVDIVLLPSFSLIWGRQLANLMAVAVLLYGFIWETD